MDWREQILDPDALRLEDYVRATYSVAVRPGKDVRQAAVEMLRILTIRTQRERLRPSEHDPNVSGAVIHVGPVGPWTEVTLALPIAYAEPHEGLTQLFQLLASPVEYSYSDGAWLQRVDLPQAHLLQAPGPQLGIRGIRARLDVPRRSLLALQVGPRRRVLDADILGAYRQALVAGADILVDDILLGNPSGLLELVHRVPLLVDVCRRASETSGRRKVYVPALSGSPLSIMRQAEWAAAAGAAGFVVNGFAHGFGTIEDLSRAGFGTCVITTNMGSGMMSRPAEGDVVGAGRRVGVDEQVFSKLSRLAGADAVHTGTTGAECFDAPWGDAVRALSQPISTAAGPINTSFRVAEGDLQLINLWPNIRELGHDTLFEVQSALLAEPGKVRDRTKRFVELLDLLAGVSTTPEALEVYRGLAQHDAHLRQQLDSIVPERW